MNIEKIKMETTSPSEGAPGIAILVYTIFIAMDHGFEWLLLLLLLLLPFLVSLFVGRSPHVQENTPTNGSDFCWSRNPFCTENQKCVE